MSDTVTIPAAVAKRYAAKLRAASCGSDDWVNDLAEHLDPLVTLRDRTALALYNAGVLSPGVADKWADVALAVVRDAVEDITGPSVGDIVRSADVIYRADVLRLLGAER